jgi:hypothetical protein
MTSTNLNTMNSGRRAFLSNAASAAALAVAVSVTGPADALNPDPIFAAIENHKAAINNVSALVSEQSRLERILPHDKRQSRVDVWREQIVETDDPCWIETERAIHNAFDAETDAACVLVSICPTTIAGVIALLRYANAVDKDSEAWPRELMSDDGTKTRSWHYFLIEVIAETLPGMVPA